ncbi:hypothetical protein [Terribacillus saccharophilus]|uniref:Phage portal protein n=1 Tax=Terribacillus saccharophilus TaxID=361277 RepID=A0ABX4H0U2_9BACI|nr:hypothetical protein [Terribacillus saccharophilus]PAD36338.1 hypothetical protein CHH56_04925 [Terribacillus saccharophilus]PAD95020.1 hypothetical protein CHH50_15560 [Terribacillus saccharophilus]PAE00757.1 hypothetical protein CHH48_05630 [Terribacillus saccharophilus]
MLDWIKVAQSNGINKSTFQKRIRDGWDIDKAAKSPVRTLSSRPDYKYILKAEKNGISRKTYVRRITNGWSPKQASEVLPDVHNTKRKDYKYILLAQKNGIPKELYNRRLKLGWSHEKAATNPVQVRGERKRVDKEWIDKALKNGINYTTYITRVNSGWSPEEAAVTPTMTAEEALQLANTIQSEIDRDRFNEINKDPDNLFHLTPELIQIGVENGISEGTIKSRVYKLGWAVHEAIDVLPIKTIINHPEFEHYAQIAKVNGIQKRNLIQRLWYGWSFERAATEPLNAKNRRIRSDASWIDKAVENGINVETYKSRVERGWSCEEAATILPLKPGQYLNEEQKEKAREAYKKYRQA